MANPSTPSAGSVSLEDRIIALESEIQNRDTVVRTKEGDIAGLMRIVEATNAAFGTANTELIKERQGLNEARLKLEALKAEKVKDGPKQGKKTVEPNAFLLVEYERQQVIRRAKSVAEDDNILTTDGLVAIVTLLNDWRIAEEYVKRYINDDDDDRAKWLRVILDVPGLDVDELVDFIV